MAFQEHVLFFEKLVSGTFLVNLKSRIFFVAYIFFLEIFITFLLCVRVNSIDNYDVKKKKSFNLLRTEAMKVGNLHSTHRLLLTD